MVDATPILGITRAKDDAKGQATGLIYRDGDRLKWGALTELFPEAATGPVKLCRLLMNQNKVVHQMLERVEFTVSGSARFLFRQTDGKLTQEELRDKLLFSEAKKALLIPQLLSKPLPIATTALEYLEISRLSDVMRKEMLGGERSQGQLAQLLGIAATDATLGETLYELARQKFLTVHESGTTAAENAIGLNRPVPGYKI